MQRKFITNLFLLLLLNLLVKPFWILGIDRAVQNEVGVASYGFYYAIFNFSFLFNILLDCGITNFNNRNISQNNQLVTKHLSGIIVLRLFLAVIYLAVSFTAGLIIGYNKQQFFFLLFVALNQILISFILYLRSNIAGLHLFKTDSLISVLDRLIMIIVCAILLWGHITNEPFKIEWYLYSQTLSYLLTAVIAMLIVGRKTELKKLNLNFPFFIMILKQSYPFAFLVLLMAFYNRIDTVMLERLLPDGAQQSGIYASAYRLLDSANMIAFLFSGLLLPMFAKMIKHRHSVEGLVKLAFTLLVIPAIVVSAGSFFYSLDIMKLLYNSHIEDSTQLFKILILCFIPISSSYIFGTLLTANGNMRELNIVAFFGMLMNVGFNFLLIPHFKAEGAVVTSLVTQGLTSIAQIVIVKYRFDFRMNYKLIGKTFVFALLSCFIFYSSHFLSFNWILRFILATAGAFAVAFFVRLIKIKEFIHILKYEE